MIYTGGGALTNASDALAAFAERIQAPVVMGENGRGALSDRHPLALNALEGRAVFPHADLVFVVGSRFVDTALGRPASRRPMRSSYVYINTDPAVVSPPRRADVFIQGDCRLALEISRAGSAAARAPKNKSGSGSQMGRRANARDRAARGLAEGAEARDS